VGKRVLKRDGDGGEKNRGVKKILQARVPGFQGERNQLESLTENESGGVQTARHTKGSNGGFYSLRGG